MVEASEQPLHQVVSPRIDRIQALHLRKAVGEVAAPAPRDGHLLQRRLLALINVDLHLRAEPPQLCSAEASRCPRPNYRCLHPFILYVAVFFHPSPSGPRPSSRLRGGRSWPPFYALPRPALVPLFVPAAAVLGRPSSPVPVAASSLFSSPRRPCMAASRHLSPPFPAANIQIFFEKNTFPEKTNPQIGVNSYKIMFKMSKSEEFYDLISILWRFYLSLHRITREPSREALCKTDSRFA